MGQGLSSAQGVERIAHQAFPLLDAANLIFSHEHLKKSGYQKIYDILKENKLLPELDTKQKKSNKASEEVRVRANQLYVRFGASEETWKMYTIAICSAEVGSPEMALAFACRSAIAFDLKEYSDSIKDIDRALSGSYPAHRSKLYARRGRCHMALGQNSKAFEDFKRAKEGLRDQSDNAAKKQLGMVDSLIHQCQNKPDRPQETTLDTIKLSHPPSSDIPCASGAVKIEYSHKQGRHVIAKTNIKPGDVLAIEKPYASVLMPEHNGNFFCDYCKMKSYSTIPCLSCVESVFCSEECRQLSWDAYHKVECDLFSTLARLSRSSNVESGIQMKIPTAIRILLKASKCGTELGLLMAKDGESVSPESAGFVDGKYSSEDYNAIHHLATNLESRTPQKLSELAVTATCLMHLLKTGTQFFANAQSMLTEPTLENSSKLDSRQIAATDLLFKYLMIVHINGHSIGDISWVKGEFPGSTSIASAVFAFHSLFNHSCDPNVTHVSFRGDTSYTIAIQPINEGQQVFEDYGDNYNAEPRGLRQFELKSHYGFTCRCIACQDDWPPFDFLPVWPLMKRADARRSLMDYFNRLPSVRNRIFQGSGTDEDLNFLSQFMILTKESVQLPWKTYIDCQDTIKCYMYLKSHPQLVKKVTEST